jgi:hypothetical protein
MKSYALALALFAVVISAKSQVYFNQSYRDTTRYTEIATNVIFNAEQEYLIANPYAPQDSVSRGAFCLKRVNVAGDLIDVQNILQPKMGIVFGNYAEAFSKIETGYIQCTQYNDTATVIKINNELDLEWTRKVPDIRSFERCIELENDELLCISNSTEPLTLLHLYWLDQNGNIVNEKHINPFVDAFFYQTSRVTELSNSDLLLSGLFLDDSDAQQWMIRLNSNGDEIWKKFWDYEYRDGFLWPIITSENEAIAAFGHVDTVYNPNSADHSWYDSRIGTMRVDLDTGDTSDVILYQGQKMGLFITDFEKTSTGGYAILAFYHNPEFPMPYSSLILNLDENRQPLWINDYSHLPIEESDQQWSQAYDIDLTPDSGFVVAGTWVDPSIDNRQAPWLFKIDGCGDLQWNNCTLTGEEEKFDQLKEVYAYPNPVINEVSIGSVDQIQEIIWFDINGKRCSPAVIDRNANQTVFATDSLQPGVYAVLVVADNERTNSLRVIVQ